MEKILTMHDLERKTLKEIYAFARDYKIAYYSQMNKKELSLAVLRAQDKKRGFVQMEGVLEIVSQEGFGFLRPINYGPSQEDVYI
ncbi:Rho termination factor N-terminal domain-containing protein [Lactiplantibacillus plajomi]